MHIKKTSKIKRGFASVLWGDFLAEGADICVELKERFNFDFNKMSTNPMAIRRKKIQTNLERYSREAYSDCCTVYVFGKDNYRTVKNLGLRAVLLQDDPYKYHPTRGIYLHKLHAYKHIMEDFNEVVLLDLDMRLTSNLPSDFWDVLNRRDIFQAPLHKYSSPRISHREGKANKIIPAGAFVYMRERSIPEKLIKLNCEAPNKWSCEPSFALLTDNMTEGWKGVEKYWELFEPQFYTARRTPYRDNEKYPKTTVFKHGNWR